MNRILLLDNEENVLSALRRELRGEYEVEAHASAKDALTRSQEVMFDLVIADYHMPDMDGVQFLKQFGEIQPDAVRMILSGHMDIHGLLGAINESHVYRFVAKPWERAVLKFEIAQALNYRRILLENRRLAESYRKSALGLDANRPERTHQYRIAVVNGNEAVLDLILNGLALGAGNGVSKDVLWREVSRDHPAVPSDVEFLVDTFRSGKQALDHTEFAKYDLVMAAPTLPDMSCIQFLEQWMRAQPDAARILMGDLADVALLSGAINQAEIYCFLDFNWDNQEMKTDVRRRIWQIHHMQSSVMETLAARELVLENERLAKEIREYG
ncbi:MAG: response regulator [Burkholderiales bacterium]|nr:response regulator [Burkholderiales bacterium]